MRLLVLGGTAWLGGEIVTAALASGHEVTCLARGESGRVPTGARFVSADRDKPDAYASVLPSTSEPSPERWDAVIDLSRSLDQVRAAVDALEPHADAYLFVSSTSAYASQSERGADEDAATFPDPDPTTPAADVPYGVAKAAAERAVLAAFGPDRSAIVRPGLIGGPGDPTGRSTYWPTRFARAAEEPTRITPAAEEPTRFAQAAEEPTRFTPAAEEPATTAQLTSPSDDERMTPPHAQRPVLVPAVPALPTALIDVRDLAAFIVSLVERGIRGVFNATSPALPFSEHVAVARQVAHHTGPLVEVDERWLLDNGVSPWAGPRSLPLWIDDRDWWGMNDRDVSRALEAGMQLRPLADTLADILAAERAANSQQSDSDASTLTDDTERTAATARTATRAGLSDADEEHLLTSWTTR